MTNYWLHRISHNSEASYPLLEEGYLSIGFSNYFSNEEFLEEFKSKDEVEAWKYFEAFNSATADFGRTRYNLWRFLYEFKIGDTVLVPKYKSFSLYEIVGEPMISGEFDGKITSNGSVIEADGNKLLYDGEAIDLGFLIPVKKIKRRIPRKEYAGARLTSRMKMRQTNGDITDLKNDVEKALDKYIKGEPISLRGAVIEEAKDKLLSKINSKLDPDKFQQLVYWYLEKIGADKVEIPAKNESFKSKGADGDIIADFDLLKVRVLVQVKFHTGETDEWGVQQIVEYSDQHQEIGDSEYTYISWVLTSADNFSEKARQLALDKNIILIKGRDFAEKLIDAGLEGIDDAFK